MHQPHPSHFSSSTIRMPFTSDWIKALLEQAFMHGACSQNLQVIATLNTGVRRITRTRDLKGFQSNSSFSKVQTYSQILQPVHLFGLAETNFLVLNLDKGMLFTLKHANSIIRLIPTGAFTSEKKASGV